MTSSKIWFERRKNENENNKSKKDKKKIILNLCLVILLLSLPLVTTQTVHAGCWTKCDTCTRTVCDTCYKTVVCEKKKVCRTCYKPKCDTYKKTVCEVRYKLECTTCKKTFSSTCYRKVPYTCKKTECKLSIGQPCSGCSCRYYGLIQGIPSWVCCYEKKYTCYRLEPYKCTRHETYTCCHRKPYKYCYEIRYKYNCHLKPYPCKCREYYDCRKVPYKCNCHKETYPCNCRRICEPLSVTILGLHDGATLRTTKNTVRLPVTVKVTGGNGWAFIGVLVDGQVKYFERVGSGTTRTIWLTLPPGTHTITAKAWDFDGNKNSKSIRVTVIKNSPPSVAIFEPRNGETLKTTGNTAKVLVKARITDDYGLFMTVVFVDGHLKDTITKSQKAITYTKWITLSPGTHTITIKAYDKSGTSSEKSVRVTVIKNSPPSITILEPRNGKTLRTTGSTAKISVKVRATDDDGLEWLAVYVDGRTAKIAHLAPLRETTYETQVSLAPGTHTITVRVSDSDYQHSEKSVRVTVVKNEPPSVTILGLHDGATLGTTKNTVRLPVTVKATDDSGWVMIGVFVDGYLKHFEGISSGTTRTIWLTLSPGTHTITAKAWDFDGGYASKSIRVTVVKNSPPSVTILEPHNGKTIKTADSTTKILVKARITDDYGLFMTVMFVDGHLKDIITKSQKAITYTKRITLSPGTHTITIKAYDKSGMSSEKSVRVTVIKNEPPSVTILEPRDGETVRTTGNTAKIPIKVRATDDSVLMVFLMVYVDGHLKYYDFVKSGTTRTIWLTLSPGTHTVTVEARDMDKASSKSSITIKVLRALKPSDVSVFVTYQNNVPLLLEKLPVRITIKKPPGDTLIQIYLQKKRTKVLMKQDTCYNTVCAYDLELPLTDFLNIPHASIAYKLLVTFDKDFTVEKTITLTRGSYFATGKEITLIYTIEKGTGPIKDIYLLYNGKKIHPLRYPKELHQQEELTVNVPFKVKVTNTAYATIVVCNYYGCDYRTVKILGTGSTLPPPPPPVIPTPRPTPKPTVAVYITPTPKPTPKPTPPPTPTRPGVNVVKVSVPEISWSHEYSKGGVPTVGK